MEEIIEENNTDGSGLTFKGFMVLLWQNVLLMAIIVIIATACGLGVALTRKPVYIATRNMIIKVNAGTNNDDNTYNNITAATRELPTVVGFFKQTVVLKKATEIYTGEGNTGKISPKKISASYDDSTRFIRVSYTDVTPELATAKVNALVRAEKEVIEETDENDASKSKYFSLTVSMSDIDGGTAKVEIKSNRLLIIALFFIGGLVLSIIVVLVKYFLDDTISTKEEVERITGAKLLAYLECIDADEVRGGGTDAKK